MSEKPKSVILPLSNREMFQFREIMTERLAKSENPAQKTQIEAYIAGTDVFLSNAWAETMRMGAEELRIDEILFKNNMPLLMKMMETTQPALGPHHPELEFEDATIIEETKTEPTEEFAPEEVSSTIEFILDKTNPEIIKIADLLNKKLEEKTNFEKWMIQAVKSTRTAVAVDEDVDEYSIIRALMKDPYDFSKKPKLNEFAKRLVILGAEAKHSLRCYIEAKKLFPTWSDMALANLVRDLVTISAPGGSYNDILDSESSIITALTKDAAFIEEMAQYWPEVSYCRKDKKTNEMVVTVLPCTEPKAAAYHISNLYNLASPKKQGKLGKRKPYIEKAYPTT
jgi:hypothetical protein